MRDVTEERIEESNTIRLHDALLPHVYVATCYQVLTRPLLDSIEDGRLISRIVDWKIALYCGESFGGLHGHCHDHDETVNLWDDPDYATQKARLKDMLSEEVLCRFERRSKRSNGCPDTISEQPVR